jgi:hypothetical protein
LQTHRVLSSINVLNPFFPVHCAYLIILFGADCRHFCYARHDLLNDAVSSLEYIASNAMMFSEYSVVRDVKGCGSGVV